MIETCLKCGHVNNASTGDDTEACPQCGAIYSKVEMAVAARRSPRQKKQGTPTWVYLLLLAILAVTLPLAIYQEVWGTTAKHRKSEARTQVAQARQRAQALEAAAQTQRDYIRLAVLEKRVVIGMTAAQVQEAWGQPTNVNRSVSAGGTNEQWVYPRGAAKTNYVYLDDGIVRSFQTSE